jgi:hypothetical protein
MTMTLVLGGTGKTGNPPFDWEALRDTAATGVWTPVLAPSSAGG